MLSFARLLCLLPLFLAGVSATHWQHVRDDREHMFLARGSERTAPYMTKRDSSEYEDSW